MSISPKKPHYGETPELSFTMDIEKKVVKEDGFAYVLSEINEVQDSLVNFFTIMFEIGILLIPVQIIIYEYIKPYEITAIKYLQSLFSIGSISNSSILFAKAILNLSNLNFLTSLNIFVYFFIDSLVSFKVCLLLGSCSYIVYILKLIIHDSRPFWINIAIQGLRCKTSFGCPTLDVFSGMFYFNFLIFNLGKRLKYHHIEYNSINIITISRYISIIFIFVNLIIGFIHVLFGENFIYQIIFSISYVYLFLRIIIVFDKLINHYAKNARIKEKTSREVAIYLFFTVIILSIFSLTIYSITSYQLQIPLNWSENIAVNLFF